MLAFLTTGGYEWIVILIVALLLFGRRLPEVMRSLGRGVSQFKKGLKDVADDVESVEGDEADEEAKQLSGGSDSESSSPTG